MKRQIVMMALGASACVGFAEEKSFLSDLFSSKKDSTAEVSASQGSQIAKLNRQLEELTAKIEKAKSLPQREVDALMKKRDEVLALLKAKMEEYKARIKPDDKETAARKAELQQTKTNAVNLVNSIRSIFK